MNGAPEACQVGEPCDSMSASLYLPIIPHGNAAHLPFEPNIMVISRVNVVFYKVEKLVRLFLLKLGNTGHETRVDVQGFQPCHRM